MKIDQKFVGHFSKSHNFTGYSEEEIEKYWDEEDERMYRKAGRDIRRILGKKDKYTGREAAYFFQKKYHCFQIPFAYEWNYRTMPRPYFARFEPFGYDEDVQLQKRFYYSEGPRPKEEEKIIALLFDYFNNERLYKRYENIKKRREEFFSRFSSPVEIYRDQCHDVLFISDVLIIGSYDKVTINSMVVFGVELFIAELEYESWYFYHHS